MTRLEAAKRLQKFAWGLNRYAQHVERACVHPSAKHQEAAEQQLRKVQALYNEFRVAKSELRRA